MVMDRLPTVAPQSEGGKRFLVLGFIEEDDNGNIVCYPQYRWYFSSKNGWQRLFVLVVREGSILSRSKRETSGRRLHGERKFYFFPYFTMYSPFFFAAVPCPQGRQGRWQLYLVNPTESDVNVNLLRASLRPADVRAETLAAGEANGKRQDFILRARSSRLVDDVLIDGSVNDPVIYTLVSVTAEGERVVATAVVPECFPALTEWFRSEWIPLLERPGCVIRTSVDWFEPADRRYTDVLSDRITNAFQFAMDIHGSMKRKCGNRPYMVHPLGVYSLLCAWDLNEDIRIAGLLHDAIEDVPEERKTEVRASLAKTFGTDVLHLIECVTESDRNLPWRERKVQAINGLARAPYGAILIACADKTHNAYSLLESYKAMGEDVWKAFNAPKTDILWYYQSILRILKERLYAKHTTGLEGYVEQLSQIICTVA